MNIGNPNYHQHTCVRCDAKENETHKMVEMTELEKTEEIEGFLVTIKTYECSVCGYQSVGRDQVALTGDITPVVVSATIAVIGMITLAGYMLKRKFAL
jgi:predicted nucleic-acid-binding Zn-ribbon protein